MYDNIEIVTLKEHWMKAGKSPMYFVFASNHHMILGQTKDILHFPYL